MVTSVFLWRNPIRDLRHPVFFSLGVLLAPALWIVFVGSFNPHEVIVGAVASLLTLIFLVFVCRSSNQELNLRFRDLIQIWRVPWYIAIDVYGVTLVAVKDLFHREQAPSLYRVCGFDASNHDPLRKARTILAVAYTTASPNIIVLGVDPSQSRMLFHQIKSSAVPKMTKALGAKS